jgi:hypothetical protein
VSHRVAFALVAGAAGVVALIVILLGTSPGFRAPELSERELSAEALVDSVGVNVHFSYVDTAYGRQAETLARLRELGVHHIRDGMPNGVIPLADGLRAASRQGIDGTLIGDPRLDPATQVASSVATMGTRIAGLEGPNELDGGADPNWVTTLRDYMPRLDAAVHKSAPAVPLIGPSLLDAASRSQLPRQLPGLANAHPYPQGGPPEPAIEAGLQDLGRAVVKRGVVFTETGYHNALDATTGQPPTSEQAAAVYLPRALVTAFGSGVRRTFVYELLDEKPDPGLVDPEQHFGLLRQDLSPKPAFVAIQTMIRALQTSPGAGSAGPRAWTLDVRGGTDDDVDRLDLVRRDHSRVIALWRPVSVWDPQSHKPQNVAPLPVRLTFPSPAQDVSVWRPSVSPQPVLRRADAGHHDIALGGDLVLVSFR